MEKELPVATPVLPLIYLSDRYSVGALEGSRRRVRLARAGIDYLTHCVYQGSIDCQWRQNGKYHAAASPRGREVSLEPYARELDVLGEPYRWLDRQEMAAATGSPYYHSGIYTPGGVLMNPVALTRGLADTLPAGVMLFEKSPVITAKLEEYHPTLYTEGYCLCRESGVCQ